MAQPLQTFDLGRTWGQAQNIVNARSQNALMQEQLNPNSLNNQYKQAQINALNYETENPGAGGYGNLNYGDFTPDSVQAHYEAGGGPENAGLLVRSYAPQIVMIAGAPHRVSRNDDGTTNVQKIPLSTLQEEGDAGAYLKNAETSGGLDAQGGIRYDAPVTSDNLNLGVQGPAQTQPAAAQQPVSAASLAAAQTTATEQAKATVKQEVEQKKNAKAYNTYVVARENLRNALQGTKTGYFSGKLPAVGAAAQIADNAQKIIFPAIKSLVREAGEGIFTDRDAIDVQAMLPTRETHPDALPAVMYNIDSYVASKLGQPPPPIPDGMVGRPDWIDEKDPRWNQLSNEQKMEIIRARGE